LLDTTRSSPVPGLSRRDFIKYCGFLATVIGLDQYAAPEVAQALEKALKKPTVVWSDFQECTGCSVALLQSTSPMPGQLVLQQIALAYNETLMAAAGAESELSLEQGLEEGAFWVVQGSIATKIPEAMSIAGKTSMEIAKEIYPKVKGTIAIGSCACFGNVQAAKPNPTGAVGLRDFLRSPEGGIPDAAVINLPRCPGNGEDLVATLTYILLFEKLPELDAEGRPLFLYGQLIHDNCERRGHFEAGQFVESPGDPNTDKKYCLYKIGCTGCSERDWWDKFSPFNQEVPNVTMPGVAGVNPATIGWAVAGVTAVGIGAHFIGQVATGRLFKGGPVTEPVVTEYANDATPKYEKSGVAAPKAEAKDMRDLEAKGETLDQAGKDVTDKANDAKKGGDA